MVLSAYIDNPDIEIDELMQHIKSTLIFQLVELFTVMMVLKKLFILVEVELSCVVRPILKKLKVGNAS
jgi:hypothetical protein